jgi:branched-subunit amino acid aminotransferase/4-amino-4-deoxychorismate lyase
VAKEDLVSDNPWREGAAYIDGRFMPVAKAAIPVTEWGYRRSDVTYDVVSVWDGAFFRLDDHLRRFQASMAHFRLRPRESMDELRGVLHELVRRAGLREAYVAMDCLRGAPAPGLARRPANAQNYLLAYAVPYVWLMPRDVIARGAHLIVSSTPRIPEACVNPRAKNFHWADMTQGLFEAEDAGADNPVLLDLDGNVTEGPGFNVFAVTAGVVATPRHGVLEGITRMSVIELCGKLGLSCEVRAVPVDELRAANELFISSTAGGVIGVTRLDGRILGNDRPGPVTNRLHEAYWSMRKQGWHAEPIDYASHAAAE